MVPADLLASPALRPLPISVPPTLRARTAKDSPPTAAPVAPRLSYSQGLPGILTASSAFMLTFMYLTNVRGALKKHQALFYMLVLQREQRGPCPCHPRAQGGWQQSPHPGLSEVPGSPDLNPSCPWTPSPKDTAAPSAWTWPRAMLQQGLSLTRLSPWNCRGMPPWWR